ncbi:MAG: type II toxin-antitoxin system prevent-host-death family antitoxin [Candidatus Humimicrobiaceae bacterium]
MLVNIKNLISLTEANQNFSKVARTVNEKGSVIILKNNVPHYIVIDFKKLEQMGISVNESLESVAFRILKDNLEAFKELAKW